MPAGNSMRTSWAPDKPVPLPEYPRPQMTRSEWINLNGEWEYAILPKAQSKPETYDGIILVPFAVESALSGVQKPLLPNQKLWYRRNFSHPVNQNSSKVLIHFGAVDYECNVWVNGKHMGSHTGGYLPFTLEITDALIQEENELLISVWDPTDSGLQQRGKQVLHPKGIWYTAVSGIWQTVWLEVVPEISIASLKLTPDLDTQTLTIEVGIRGAGEGIRAEAEIISNGENILVGGGPVDHPIRCEIPHPRVWSPTDPHLYELKVQLIRDEKCLDEVGSYFAMRKFGLMKDRWGHLRISLNGEPLFLYGPLDQGYFPEGLYTPPSEEAMVFDIEFTRAMGCNMIRKHVKVEPLRWYYHCDRLGTIVWQDMPNGGQIDGNVVAVLSLMLNFHRNDTHRLKRFGRSDVKNRAEYRSELQGMIDHLYNMVCIAVWVPFNESWGQFHAREVGKWVKEYDPTRLVDHASGWFDQEGGNFQSKHVYVKKLKQPEPDGRAFVLSEFGGYSLKVAGHLWDLEKKFGYRFYDSPETLTEAYRDLLKNELTPLLKQGLAAAIYTQTTDVETEINGFLTYDRKIEKMNRVILQKIHAELLSKDDQ